MPNIGVKQESLDKLKLVVDKIKAKLSANNDPFVKRAANNIQVSDAIDIMFDMARGALEI